MNSLKELGFGNSLEQESQVEVLGEAKKEIWGAFTWLPLCHEKLVEFSVGH